MDDRALQMRELRAENKEIVALLHKMLSHIDPFPEFRYDKSLNGVLRHCVWILDDLWPDWQQMNKHLPRKSIEGYRERFKVIKGPDLLGELPN
jgi:hypothetical protein